MAYLPVVCAHLRFMYVNIKLLNAPFLCMCKNNSVIVRVVLRQSADLACHRHTMFPGKYKFEDD